MSFYSPYVIRSIPDIAKLYEINEGQEQDLDDAVDAMSDDMFFEDMDEPTCARWEKMLSIIPLDTDSIDDRRFKIQTKVMERLPYSYRVIVQKLNTLCPNGFDFFVDSLRQAVTIRLSLESRNMIEAVQEYMEDVLPLNMVYVINVLFNSHEVLSHHTHAELAAYTHQQLREEESL